MQLSKTMGLLAACALAASASTALAQANSPHGIWLDHTGRAAVEINDCSGKLCGKLVWFKDPSNASKACGLQIIGDVPRAGARWDGGWILDPEKDSKYDVEITPLANDKLRVMGYAGMKMLSETYTWTRAAPDLQRCDKTAARTEPEPSATPPAATKPDSGIPFTPPGERPKTGAVPGPGPSTGEGNPPAPPPGKAPQRKTAKKNCTFEVPGVNIKVTVPCDEDD
jgi:uncharacterized protein (DUF2147 family)